MKNKIRILLFVLTLLFFATAVTVKNSITDLDVLKLETKNLTHRLHYKEIVLDSLLSNEDYVKIFKNSERYPLQVRELANQYKDQQIYLYIFKKTSPIFWTSNIYVPETDAGLKEGLSYINGDNFSFLVNRKILDSDLSVVALVPIQRHFIKNYVSKNPQNFIAEISNTQLQLAEFGDTDNIKNIYSSKGDYWFSVKLRDGKYDNIYINIQVICWILGILSLVILISGVSVNIAKNGKPFLSIAILCLTFSIIRYIDLETNWLSQISNYNIFSPKAYAYNYFTPNLWSYLINSIIVLWVICYLIYIKKYIVFPNFIFKSKFRVWLFAIVLFVTYFIYNRIFEQLSTLITHSSSNYDELITLFFKYGFTIFHVIIYSVNIICFILIADIVIYLGKNLCPKMITNLNVQLIVLVFVLIISGFFQNFSLINVLIGVFILVRSFDKSLLKDNAIYTQVIGIICIAIITTIEYAEAVKINNTENMKLMLINLESDDEIESISLFSKIESSMKEDIQLQRLIQLGKENANKQVISDYIRKNYFAAYQSNYNISAYFLYNDIPLTKSDEDQLQIYREKVIKSTKVNHTQNFYKSKSDIGQFDYFSLLNFDDKNGNNYSIILNLKKNLNVYSSAVPFFNNNSVNEHLLSFRYKNYNYAIYQDGALINQNGKFTYSNTDEYEDYPINEFISVLNGDDYYHLILKPNKNTTLIVSKSTQSYWQFITVISITFLYVYVLILVVRLLFLILPKYFNKDISFKDLQYQARFIVSKIRYSTRIQTLVIASVLLAIIISGIISFYSIKLQTERNRKDQKLDYVSQVVNNLENLSSADTSRNILMTLHDNMKNLTDILVTDFNLYDRNGKLFFTTQPGIYNHHLISSYLNPTAFIDLNVIKKNETLIKEQIIDFNYESTYGSIKDANYKTIAYLGVPYFNYQDIENENTNILLKTILNIYTVIIIIFAFLAVYISNKITEPLQLIRRKLSQTDISSNHNESLYWEKDDEIGLLVKEYNQMIVKLEEHALQLRHAERESVWREMAQQVAHEIKNPLTPMKLGIQQLNRSFKDNDSRFPERFEKVSNSFIEQIETLSRIASEFSAFAKLPEAKFLKINIIEKINKSLLVYNNTPNVHIDLINETNNENLVVYGDRDQLIRTFNNLIKNAIEASTGRRKIAIHIIVKEIEDNQLAIDVIDNGFGIPDDVLPKIFKPNFTTKSSGTGLGLAFVKQTITGMGGSINFETKLNYGTTFHIIIPKYDESKSEMQ